MFPSIVTVLALAASALANTEIVNFEPTNTPAVNIPFTSSWPTFSPSRPSLALNVTSAPLGSAFKDDLCPSLRSWGVEKPHADLCRYEMYVVLDLDAPEWAAFDKFTLRVSWPAFHPTDFKLSILDPSELSKFASRAPPAAEDNKPSAPDNTRRKYARIQFVHTGVLTPSSSSSSSQKQKHTKKGKVSKSDTDPDTEPFDPTLSLDDVSPASRARRTLPIDIVLEPLYFGILPKSMLPVAIAILAVVVVCLPVAWGAHSLLKDVAAQAKRREEARRRVKEAKKE